MTMTSIILASVGIALSVISIILSCVSVSMVSGFLRSTHQVSWVPYDPEGKSEGESGEKKSKKDLPQDVLEELEQEIYF